MIAGLERTNRKKAEISAGELQAQSKLHHMRLKGDSENDESDTSLEIRLEISKLPSQYRHSVDLI